MDDTKELALVKAEFTGNVKEMEQLAGQDSALVPYTPKSAAPFKMDTLIPRNMVFEVQKALNTVVLEKGNIDTYVRNSLKYVSNSALWDALSAEQIDSIGLYLKQFEMEQGMIIADQTGIGKGRQAAGVIRHAVKNEYLPIFFTKSPDLFTDMYRDLKAIGMADIHPFIVNTDPKAKIKDAKGNVVFSPLSVDAQLELLTTSKTYPTESKEVIDWHRENDRMLPDPKTTPEFTIVESTHTMPEGYDMIFCSYSQIQSAHPYKRNWIQELCSASGHGNQKYKGVIFILDESHMAGGFTSIIGKWMRGVLPNTKSCCFLSATFAKYPEVMPLYAKKSALSETGLKDEQFVHAMTSGGLALQEIVASNLSQSGQLIRRQRSNEGIAIEYFTLDKEPIRSLNRQRVNSIIGLMQRIVKFEADFINPVLSEIHENAKNLDERVGKKPKGLGVKQSPFFSKVFSIIDQLLFALKVEAVAENALELLAQDKKVVIAFKSTMGTFLKDMKLSSGDMVAVKDLDFITTLLKSLDALFYYSYTDIGGNKSKEKISIDDISQRGREEYDAIKKAIKLERSNLSISPIDQLIGLIEGQEKPSNLGGHDESHFRVAEVTGRNQRLSFEDDTAMVSSFRSDTEKSFRLFNSGHYDVLLINQSGSTGASAHSSKDFKDQRQRWMLIHQFELDINIEVQKRGRINRTGQVNMPGYRYIISDIPMEVRLINMLKSKLKSLDANTTGSQKTNEDTLKSADFLNKYGDEVAWQWVDDNPEMAAQLGKPTYINSWGEEKRAASKEGTMRQVTGRAGLLLVEEQEKVYNDLLLRYHKQIQNEKQQGTYDLEVEFLKLDGEVKKRFLHAQGNDGVTPFGKDTIREVTIVNNLKRPFTKNELDTRVMEALEGKDALELKDALRIEVETQYPKLIEKRKKKKQEALDHSKKQLSTLPELGSGTTEDQNEKIAFDRQQVQEVIQDITFGIQTLEKNLQYVQAKILRYIGYFQIGQLLKIPHSDAIREPSWGVFLGITIGRTTKNPYVLSNIELKFAVADSRKYLSYNLTPEQVSFISNIYVESKDISEADRLSIPNQWNQMIKHASAKRERRQILTENIVAAASEIGSKNKLIKYNTKQGVIKSGILMARDFGTEEHFALLHISTGTEKLKSLALDTTFEDHRGGVRFKRLSEGHFQVLIKKGEHYKMSIDPRLRALLLKQEGQPGDELPNFVQNAGDMTGLLPLKHIDAFLMILDAYSLKIEAKAEELKDWEVENDKDWTDRTLKSEKRYHYELGKPYGQGSNPNAGFIDYIEPSQSSFSLGEVIYDRPLSGKEKYNHGLIPVFDIPEIPYSAWKKAMKGSPIDSEFKALVTEVKIMPLHRAIAKLGYFIFNHPHEQGNPEFVFGRYTPIDLGTSAYQDMLAPITAIDILNSQLQIILQAA